MPLGLGALLVSSVKRVAMLLKAAQGAGHAQQEHFQALEVGCAAHAMQVPSRQHQEAVLVKCAQQEHFQKTALRHAGLVLPEPFQGLQAPSAASARLATLLIALSHVKPVLAGPLLKTTNVIPVLRAKFPCQVVSLANLALGSCFGTALTTLERNVKWNWEKLRWRRPCGFYQLS